MIKLRKSHENYVKQKEFNNVMLHLYMSTGLRAHTWLGHIKDVFNNFSAKTPESLHAFDLMTSLGATESPIKKKK